MKYLHWKMLLSKILYQSQVGEGTTFRIRPLSPDWSPQVLLEYK